MGDESRRLLMTMTIPRYPVCVRASLTVLLACTVLAWSVGARSALPEFAEFVAPAVGQSATRTFMVEDFTGLDDPRVQLCIPGCLGPDTPSVSGSGTLSDNGSEWILGGVSNCTVFEESYSCDVTVTYRAGDERPRAAELRSVTGESFTSAFGNASVESATLEGRVAERSLEPGFPQFAQSSYAVEEGDAIEVQVQRLGGTDGALSVRYTAFDDRNSELTASGDDYELSPPSGDILLWENGDDSLRSIRVAATADDRREGTESLGLVVEVDSGSDAATPRVRSAGSGDEVVIDIGDVVPMPGFARFEFDGYSVREGGSVDLTVRRVGGSDGPLSVTWSIGADSNAGAEDFRLNPMAGSTLRWTAGDTGTRTITVDALADAIADPEEFLYLFIDQDDDIGSDFCCVFTEVELVDVPPPLEPGSVQFTQADYSVVENAGPATLTVTRTGGSDGIATVDFRFVDGTATRGVDYGAVSEGGADGRLVWQDGESGAKTITIPIRDDDVPEPDETFSVALSLPPVLTLARSATSAADALRPTLGTPATATVTIVNDDRIPTEPDRISFAAATIRIAEADGNARLVVRRVGTGEGPVTVGYTLAAGTAQPATDLVPNTPLQGTLTWPDADTADRVIDIGIVDDQLVEADETFSVALGQPSGADLGTPATATITIVDDDVESVPGVLDFAPVRYAVAENAGPVTLTVARTAGSDGPASVRWAAADRTAQAGSDYAPGESSLAGTLEWEPGDAGPRTITLGIVDDGVAEPDETFVVTLSGASGAALGQSSVATVVIGDVTPAEPDRVSVVAAARSVGEGDGSIRIAVRRTGNGEGPASVRYALAAGTAQPATDLGPDTPLEGTLSWTTDAVGDRFIDLPIVDDDLVEADETFVVTLSQPSGVELVAPLATSVTIVDDDSGGLLAFDPVRYAVDEDEDGGSVTLSVSRTGGSDGAATVRWAASDVTARAGEDYGVGEAAELAGVLEWVAGDATARTIVLDIADDGLAEPDEDFVVTLSAPGGAALGAATVATVTIGDVTDPVLDRLRFVQAARTVNEDDGAVRLVVQRVGSGQGAVTVGYTLVAGTASLATDLAPDTPRQGVLTWDAGDTDDRFIDIAIVDDDVVEEDERFDVTLGQPGGAELGSPATATVTLVDTTPPPDTVALAQSAYTAVEGGGMLSFAIRRLGGGRGAASVGYRVMAGSATTPLDFTAAGATSGLVDWAAGDTNDRIVAVTIVDDALPEADETFTIVLVEPVGVTLGRPAEATVTITDDDEAGSLSFAPARYAVDENAGTVTLTVSRTGGSAGPATVRWTAANRSARAGSDYALGGAALTGSLAWTAGDGGTRSITLDIADDGVPEPEENFVVTLSAPTGAALGPAPVATVLIGDVTPTVLDRIRFATAAVDVGEGDGSVRLVVRRVGSGAGAASVSYALNAGTAALGEDLAGGTPLEGTLAWGNADTADRFIDIAIADDALVEDDERFTVTLREPAGAVLGSPTSSEVTVVDDDVPPLPVPGNVAFTAASLSVAESDGQVVVTVERIDGTDGELMVRYETVDDGAVAGEDYTAANGMLRWEDGESGTRVVTIAIARDARVESDERFRVQLRDASAAGEPLPLEASEISVTITDSTNVGELSVLDFAPQILESGGEAIVQVARSSGSDGVLRVPYETVAETATAGDDFTPREGELVWADGETGTRAVRVPIRDDAIPEGRETFLVRFPDIAPPTLVATASTFRVLAVGDVRVTIVDDDQGIISPDVDALAELGSLRLEITSGDAQSGQPDDILEPMSANVVDADADGARRPGIPVRWRVVPAGSAVLLDEARTVSDENGEVRNSVRIVSRGFVNVIATIDVTGPSSGPDAPPGPEAVADPGEAIFLVRAGLAVASGLNGNQSRTGAALENACDALTSRIAAGDEVDEGIGDGELDLFDTCGELDARLVDGRLPAALDRLAPEELFAIADSIVDTNDIQVTNVYARINAIRRGRRNAVDVAGLDLDLYGERIPGSVVEAAREALAGRRGIDGPAAGWGGIDRLATRDVASEGSRRGELSPDSLQPERVRWTDLPSGGGAAADDAAGPGSRLGFFVNGTISFGEIDSDGNQADADVNTRGLTIGADYRFSENAVIGIGLGIVANETTFVRGGGSVDLDGVALTVFGTFYEEATGYVDAVFDLGRNRYDVRRRMNLPGLAEQFGLGETDADVLSLTFSAGKDIARGPWEFGPYLRASYTSAQVDGYSERASSDAAGFGSVLDIRGHDVSSARLSLGGQVSRTIGTQRGVLVPQLRVEAEFETEDRKEGISASFRYDPSSTPFVVEGDSYDSGYVNVGLGGSGVFANGRSGYLFYETRLAHQFVTQHWLKVGIRLEF